MFFGKSGYLEMYTQITEHSCVFGGLGNIEAPLIDFDDVGCPRRWDDSLGWLACCPAGYLLASWLPSATTVLQIAGIVTIRPQDKY